MYNRREGKINKVERLEKWINKPIPKNLLLTFIPALLTFFIAWYFSPFSKGVSTLLIIAILAILTIQGICILHYTRVEVNKNRAMDELRRQNTAFRKADRIIRSLFQTDAHILTEVASDIVEKGTVNLAPVSISTCCGDLCKAIYDVVSSFDASSNLEVTYVARIDDDHIMTIGYYNTTNEYPTVFEKKRKIDETKAFFDAQQFRHNGDMGIQALSEEALHSRFVSSLGENKYDKYKQYISAPVLCAKNKMIGLIQVVANNDSRLALDDDQLRNIADTYLNTFANLILLKSKTEKVISATPQNIPALKG